MSIEELRQLINSIIIHRPEEISAADLNYVLNEMLYNSDLQHKLATGASGQIIIADSNGYGVLSGIAIEDLVVPGPTGATGIQGATGPIGIEGIMGPQGDTGPQGQRGATGPQGVTGPQGAAGSTGPQGVTGPAGTQGTCGLRGEPGPQGPEGPRGATGVHGEMGATGPQGATGASITYTGGNNINVLGNTISALGYEYDTISNSVTAGEGTITSNQSEIAIGRYNVSNSGTVYSVGIGTDSEHRKNAIEIMNDGEIYIMNIGNYDGTNAGGTGIQSLQSFLSSI